MGIQALIKGIGGTVETHFLDRQVASCTVSVFTGAGAKRVDGATATVDSVSTTTAAIGAAGDPSITVTSSTGIVAGRRYLIGATAGSEPREVVTAKSISGNVVTLWAPLTYDHATGATVHGLRVSYAVSASACDMLWWDGWADFTPDSGDVNTEVVYCVLRKIPDDLISEADLWLVFPKGAQLLDAELDMGAALREARDQFLFDLGGKNRAHTVLGVDAFRRPAAIKFWLLRRQTFGDEWSKAMDLLQADYDALLVKIIEQVPVDADQDGTTTGRDDGGVTMIALSRS